MSINTTALKSNIVTEHTSSLSHSFKSNSLSFNIQHIKHVDKELEFFIFGHSLHPRNTLTFIQ